MFEDVIDLHLEPKRAYSKRKKTDLILIHHVEGKMTVQEIHEMHLADSKKNYAGIAYNLYIDTDGKRYWGRGPDYAGGSVKSKGKTAGMNARAYAIVCNGNFKKEHMSDVQKASLFLSVEEACLNPDWDINSITQIKGHGEVDDTDCPGKYFPLDELREHIRTYKPKLVEDEDTEEATSTSEAAGLQLGRLLSYKCTVKSALNFRATPSTADKPLGVFRAGDVLTVTGAVSGDWVPVYANGKSGWVHKDYIKYSTMLSGEDVKALQEALKESGSNPGAIDGVFGQQTAQAVTDAQKQKNITADGIAGKQTTAALGGTWTGKK